MSALSFLLGFACGGVLASAVLIWLAIKIADVVPRF